MVDHTVSRVDDSSTMLEDVGADLSQRVAGRVRSLRAQQGLSLEALAARSGVSRSMISLIERGESSPTAVVPEKLGPHWAWCWPRCSRPRPQAVRPTRSRDGRPSPPGAGQPMQVVEVQFPAGARVAFDSVHREHRVHQQVWVLEGSMDVTTGARQHRLRQGDCLAMTLDDPVLFHNPTRKPARYAVVIAR
jgi:mannose-6-phosphate isomerase-like protein (cupin superfamily)